MRQVETVKAMVIIVIPYLLTALRLAIGFFTIPMVIGAILTAGCIITGFVKVETVNPSDYWTGFWAFIAASIIGGIIAFRFYP